MYRQLLLLLLVTVYVSGAAKNEHQEAAENPAKREKVSKELEELDRELEEEEDEEKDLFEEEHDEAEAEDDAVFVDDDILNNLQKSKRPPSSNRKCMRFYRGHWQSPPCNANENQVGSRNKGAEVCCSPCVETEWCANKGGMCTYSWKCATNYRKRGCGGKCGCCY